MTGMPGFPARQPVLGAGAGPGAGAAAGCAAAVQAALRVFARPLHGAWAGRH